MKISKETMKKPAIIFITILLLLTIVACLFAITTESRNHLFQHEYARGYGDAQKHQEFKIASNQDTVFVFHDGARFSFVVASDTINLDFVRFSDFSKEEQP